MTYSRILVNVDFFNVFFLGIVFVILVFVIGRYVWVFFWTFFWGCWFLWLFLCILFFLVGFKMFVVGVGNAVEDELREIVFEFVVEYYFYIVDFKIIN